MTKFYWFLGHEQFQPEELVEHAQLAEEAGFDGVMVSDHLQPWVDDVGASGFAPSTLGALALATKRLRIMTGVITPLFRYHPALVAQMAATLDRLSGGRFELGVGTGENLNEAPLGFSLPSYAERAARMNEAIDIIRGLLDGKRVDARDQYYMVQNLKLYSPPSSLVPLYLAANGPQSARLAVRKCDGVITSVKNVAETRTNIVESMVGAPRRLIATRWSVYAEHDDEAWQALRPWRGLRAPHRATLTDPVALEEEADTLAHDQILKQYAQVREVNDFIDEYAPLITELHADTICFQVTSLDQRHTIKLVGGHVLPVLRRL